MGAAVDRTQTTGHTLPEADRATLMDIVRARGETAACASLRISRQTLGRGIAGLDLQLGTVVLIQQRLATVGDR
jgi:hypothetical protein